MSFSINTNVTSLQAQNSLRASSDFQSKTINRVTSGLRIVQSGDDAAGLAIANGFRSDEAVLAQGIRNANDGMSTLQTIDGGMSNISNLLDRARTLATQSASGTFTGDRSLLNSEFQSVMTEVNRQSQAIGLNTGGTFAKSLSVFIGGGKGTDATSVLTNGSVAVDLSNSTVDTKSLGLQGYTAGYHVATSAAADSGFYDLSNTSKKSSVSAILTAASSPTSTTFTIGGPNFTAKTVTVNLNGVTDSASLATAINAGLTSAGTTNADVKAAGITAFIHTGTDGAQQLEFSSANAAFSVRAGDTTANAFMGNLTGAVGGNNAATAATGVALAANSTFISTGTQQVTSTFSSLLTANVDTQTVTFTALDSTGTPHAKAVTLVATAADQTATMAAVTINAALQQTNIAALQGIVATANSTDTGITFADANSANFTVSFGAKTGTAVTAATGFTTDANTIQTSTQVGVSSTADISSQSAALTAVSALQTAVSSLGAAQAAVGKGENNFTYAANLAQSQSTNLAAAESRIRDADLASEAANLTKAQILVQAGTAALAQANSAPQAILSLLKG